MLGCMISEIFCFKTSSPLVEVMDANIFLSPKNLKISVEVTIPISLPSSTTGILLKLFLTIILEQLSIGVPGVVVMTSLIMTSSTVSSIKTPARAKAKSLSVTIPTNLPSASKTGREPIPFSVIKSTLSPIEYFGVIEITPLLMISLTGSLIAAKKLSLCFFSIISNLLPPPRKSSISIAVTIPKSFFEPGSVTGNLLNSFSIIISAASLMVLV